MAHYSYIDEIEKKTRRSQFYWLGFIGIVLLTIIFVLVIIKQESELFVRVQEIKTEQNELTEEEKMAIEGRLLAGWAKRDLGIEDKAEIEENLLPDEPRVLSESEKREIEQKLNNGS